MSDSVVKIKTTEETKQRWANLSNDYADILAGCCSYSHRSLVGQMELGKPGLHVLEVGCGAGNNLPHLASALHESSMLYLTDYVPEMIEKAKVYLTQLPTHLGSLVQSITIEDSQAMTFPDGFCDRYLANLVLHLVPDGVKMLNEAYRLLRPGGIAGFSVWGAKEHSNLFTTIPGLLAQKGNPPSQDRSQFHLGDPTKLRDMALAAGFRGVVHYNTRNIKGITKEQIKDLGPYYHKEYPMLTEQEIMTAFEEHLNQGNVVGFDALIIVAFK